VQSKVAPQRLLEVFAMNAKLNPQTTPAAATPAADDDLVFAAKSGDPMAFTELWRRYSKRMLSTIMRITHNYEDAEDALQDSFLRVYLHLTDFRGQSKFSSWMTSIAINSALMSLRRRRSRQFFSIDSHATELPSDYREPESPLPSAEDQCIRRQQMHHLGTAIARLPGSLRGVMEIRLSQASGIDQVATTAGLSLSATKSRLMRGKNELRRTMNRRGQL
jgi:RNA polymerase sigma-70 factor, ECF subfamily